MGDFVVDTELREVFVCKCRDESNSNYAISQTADGRKINYNYTVYMPKNAPALQIGDYIKVMNLCGKEVRCEGVVQLIKKEQLHNRLYI